MQPMVWAKCKQDGPSKEMKKLVNQCIKQAVCTLCKCPSAKSIVAHAREAMTLSDRKSE